MYSTGNLVNNEFQLHRFTITNTITTIDSSGGGGGGGGGSSSSKSSSPSSSTSISSLSPANATRRGNSSPINMLLCPYVLPLYLILFLLFLLLAARHTCRRTYVLPRILSFFLSSFFRRLISQLAERNSTTIGYMLGSKCDLKPHVRNLGYPFHYNSGAQNHLFRPLRNLTANLTAYIFGTKHDIDNRLSALQTTRGLLRHPKTLRTLVDKRLQTGPPLLPTLCKCCFLRHCQASQTEISKQNSTKLCQTADGKSRLTICCSTVRVVPHKSNGGQETSTFVRFLGDFDTSTRSPTKC